MGYSVPRKGVRSTADDPLAHHRTATAQAVEHRDRAEPDRLATPLLGQVRRGLRTADADGPGKLASTTRWKPTEES